MHTSNRNWASGVVGAMLLSLASYSGIASADVAQPGAMCKAAGTAQASLHHGDGGTVYNKKTAGTLKVVCPLGASVGYYTDVYLSFIKRTSASMPCTFLRRSFDGLSGSSSTQSTTYNGASYFYFGGYVTDYWNVVTCTIPTSTGTSTSVMNGINGVWFYQY